MKLREEILLNLNEFNRLYIPIMCELELDEDSYFTHIRAIYLKQEEFNKDQICDLRKILIDIRNYFWDITKDKNFPYHQYDSIFKRLIDLTNQIAGMVWEEHNSVMD